MPWSERFEERRDSYLKLGVTEGTSTRVTEQKDPCHREREFSMKCVETNCYDHSACQKHYANYKACKTFWMNVRRARVENGISPPLPSAEEQARIKKKYLETGEIPLTG